MKKYLHFMLVVASALFFGCKPNGGSCRDIILSTAIEYVKQHPEWRFNVITEHTSAGSFPSKSTIPHVLELDGKSAQVFYDNFIRKTFFPVYLELPSDVHMAVAVFSSSKNDAGMFLMVIDARNSGSALLLKQSILNQTSKEDITDVVFLKDACMTILRTTGGYEINRFHSTLVGVLGKSL